MVCITVKLN